MTRALLFTAIVIGFLTIACGGSSEATDDEPTISNFAAGSTERAATHEARTVAAGGPTRDPNAPTNTPRPTNTPGPTNTPEPTNTPKPTATPEGRLAGGFTLKQTVSVRASDAPKYAVGQTCGGTGGYSDIVNGMEVTLLEGGKIVGLGRLEQSEIILSTLSGVDTTYVCRFRFYLQMPATGEFFVVKVGRRGERTYTREELQQPLTLAYFIE